MIDIYGKPNCPFCSQAVDLCEKMHLPYSYKTVGDDLSREDLLEMFPNAKTVPQISVHGQPVGGFSEFEAYIEQTGYNGTGATL